MKRNIYTILKIDRLNEKDIDNLNKIKVKIFNNI